MRGLNNPKPFQRYDTFDFHGKSTLIDVFYRRKDPKTRKGRKQFYQLLKKKPINPSASRKLAGPQKQFHGNFPLGSMMDLQ